MPRDDRPRDRRRRHVQPARACCRTLRASGSSRCRELAEVAGRRQRLDRRHGGVARRARRAACSARTLAENGGGAGGFHDGLAWARRARRRPGLADGRRRAARPRTASPGCSQERDLDFWGPLVVDEADPAGWSSRSGCPAAPGSCTELADVERAARDGPDRRHRDPVQRRAGHPRAGRADRAAARGVLHLGRRPRVPAARRGRRRPDRHRRRRAGPAPGRRRASARR